MERRSKWLISLIITLAASACSPERGETPAGLPSPSPYLPNETPAPAAKTRSYGSMERVIADIESQVGAVSVDPIGPGDNAATLKDFAILDWEGARTNVYLFEDRAQRDLWLPQISAEFEVLYGPNWIVVPFGATDLLRSIVGGRSAGGP